MKNAIFLILTLFVFATLAARSEALIGLPKGTTKISALTAERISYDVRTVVPKCPEGKACEMVSIMKLNVRLSGCVDNAELFYNFENMADSKIVTVTVLNIHNSKSATTKCVMMPTKSFSIHLGRGIVAKENVKLVVSEYLARKD